MKTLRLTAKDFKYTENYWKEYIGKEDVSDYDGNIEIEAKLGYIRFNSIKAKGYILAEAGSGIKAGFGIEAGKNAPSVVPKSQEPRGTEQGYQNNHLYRW